MDLKALVMESDTSKFTVIPAHKYRRSSRSQHQPSSSMAATVEQSHSARGHFERIPIEVFHMILEYLPVKEISALSMVSKAISSCIAGNISTLAWRNRMMLQEFHKCGQHNKEDSILEHYRALGLLFKRCTFLLPTKERLKFIYSKLSQVPCFTMGRCSAMPGCLGFASYGVFLQTLIAGWDELECHRVFNFLCDFTSLSRKIHTVVTSKSGVSPRLEIQIRLFCRNVLLDHWQSSRDTLFWLTRILKPWPMVNQARLIYIIYGPLTLDGRIGWQKLTEGAAEESNVKDMADAIRLLHGDQETKEWTADSVISLIDELSAVPSEWLLENSARLLILCGNRICYTSMASKAVSGRVSEARQDGRFLALVCEKDSYCMDWAVKMMQKICKVFSNAEEKWNFLQTVENVFCQVTMELYESVMAGDRNEDTDTFQSLCNVLNANAHFHTEILYTFIKKE
ncbi:F-box only protein 47-like isoform X2 [Huso huso]|uniref:F-box only protein 47-like isoform X2 n=1 Tax=Huso huso TaxID=61971 RepID=A0ABR0ZKJ4_HUSHU